MTFTLSGVEDTSPLVKQKYNSYHNLTGMRFGLLLILERVVKFERENGRHVYWWRCVCDCGTYTFVERSALMGKKISCGCYQKFLNKMCPVFRAIIVDHHLNTTKTFEEIGKHFGITKNAVAGLLDRERKRIETMTEPKQRAMWFPPHNQCVFPKGHPGEPGFTWCCEKIKPGSSYCPAHHSVVYLVEGAKRRSSIASADFSIPVIGGPRKAA